MRGRGFGRTGTREIRFWTENLRMGLKLDCGTIGFDWTATRRIAGGGALLSEEPKAVAEKARGIYESELREELEQEHAGRYCASSRCLAATFSETPLIKQ